MTAADKIAKAGPPCPTMLRLLISCEPETGKLFWRHRPLWLFATKRGCSTWNAKWAGKEAFTAANYQGYRDGRIFGRPYRAHRVIWAMVNGRWPADQIDHINGDRSDNRVANLREARPAENQWNTGLASTNTSGFKGVSWSQSSNRWSACIRHCGTQHYLGCFDTPEDAARAYDAAAIRLHGEFGRLNFPRTMQEVAA